LYGTSVPSSSGGVDPTLRAIVAKRQMGELRPFDLSKRCLSFEWKNAFDKKGRLILRIENQDLAYFDSPALMKGTSVSFSWGYNGNSSEVMEGFVSGMKGFQVVEIEITQDEGFLDWSQESTVWTARTRSQIAREIAQVAGFLRFKITETNDLADYKQIRETQREFLVRIAEEINFIVTTGMEAGVPVFSFHERIERKVPFKTYIWRGGQGFLKTFNITDNSIVGLPGSIEGAAYDPDNRIPISATGSRLTSLSTPLGSVTEVVDPETGSTSFPDPTRLKKAGGKMIMATAEKRLGVLQKQVSGAWDKAQEAQFKAKATVVGDPRLDATQYIIIEGVPMMLKGIYYVAEISHKIASGYETGMTLIRNALGDLPIAPEQRTAVAGLPNTKKAAGAGDLIPHEMVNPTGKTSFRIYQPPS